MLFCNHCGQCSLISDRRFYRYDYGNASCTAYLDEFGDTEDTEGTDIDNWEPGDETYCPRCNGNDIDYDWNGTEQDAEDARKEHDIAMEKLKEVEHQRKTGWDA